MQALREEHHERVAEILTEEEQQALRNAMLTLLDSTSLEQITIRELAEQVIEITGAKSELVFRPLPQDDPMQRQPNIGKAKQLLGWEPKVDLRTGLGKTIDYFRAFV